LIKVAININNRLYKQNIKKKYNQSYRRAEISFESVIENYTKRNYFKKYNNPDYCKSALIKLDSI